MWQSAFLLIKEKKKKGKEKFSMLFFMNTVVLTQNGVVLYMLLWASIQNLLLYEKAEMRDSV